MVKETAINPADYPSETAKYRHLTKKYCAGSRAWTSPARGTRLSRWAISFDLPVEEFNVYCSNTPPKGVIHLRGHADSLPFETGTLDFVYSSHLLEDYLNWDPVLYEWARVIKPGGHLIILVPDKDRWAAALAKGQSPELCA